MRWDTAFLFVSLFNDGAISSTLLSGCCIDWCRFPASSPCHSQLLAQCGLSHVLGVWLQNYSTTEPHLPLPMVAVQVIMPLILFSFQHKHLEWVVTSQRKWIITFLWMFLLHAFAIQWLLKCQQFKIFLRSSLILILSASKWLGQIIDLNKYSVPSYNIKCNTPYSKLGMTDSSK